MVGKSKFEKGMKVQSILNIGETYEVLEVLKNELRVKALSSGITFSCKKSLFGVIE